MTKWAKNYLTLLSLYRRPSKTVSSPTKLLIFKTVRQLLIPQGNPSQMHVIIWGMPVATRNGDTEANKHYIVKSKITPGSKALQETVIHGTHCSQTQCTYRSKAQCTSRNNNSLC